MCGLYIMDHSPLPYILSLESSNNIQPMSLQVPETLSVPCKASKAPSVDEGTRQDGKQWRQLHKTHIATAAEA